MGICSSGSSYLEVRLFVSSTFSDVLESLWDIVSRSVVGAVVRDLWRPQQPLGGFKALHLHVRIRILHLHYLALMVHGKSNSVVKEWWGSKSHQLGMQNWRRDCLSIKTGCWRTVWTKQELINQCCFKWGMIDLVYPFKQLCWDILVAANQGPPSMHIV